MVFGATVFNPVWCCLSNMISWCYYVHLWQLCVFNPSGDGTLGVLNIKRRRFELLSEIQIGDLTSVSIMKVSVKRWSVIVTAILPFLLSACILWLITISFSLTHREVVRLCVAPPRALYTSSTGMVLGPPVTVLIFRQSLWIVSFLLQRVYCVLPLWMVLSGKTISKSISMSRAGRFFSFFRFIRIYVFNAI